MLGKRAFGAIIAVIVIIAIGAIIVIVEDGAEEADPVLRRVVSIIGIERATVVCI